MNMLISILSKRDWLNIALIVLTAAGKICDHVSKDK